MLFQRAFPEILMSRRKFSCLSCRWHPVLSLQEKDQEKKKGLPRAQHARSRLVLDDLVDHRKKRPLQSDVGGLTLFTLLYNSSGCATQRATCTTYGKDSFRNGKPGPEQCSKLAFMDISSQEKRPYKTTNNPPFCKTPLKKTQPPRVPPVRCACPFLPYRDPSNTYQINRLTNLKNSKGHAAGRS